jgi:phenylacetate-coenzyme A ligase PaaK-like adenylate-forming protein
MNLIDLLEYNPFELDVKKKEAVFNSLLNKLTIYHYNNCKEYKKIIDASFFNFNNEIDKKEIPFLPVRLFKLIDLKSIKDEDVIKTMTSSGTTGQAVSKIYLDKETALNQTKVLTKIVSSLIGKHRMPMLIIDSESVIRDRNLFSARGAGIIGFSLFASKKLFVLNEKMEINIEALKIFMDQNKDQKILIFGFTFMIWQHFYKELVEKNIKIDLSNSILLHGGGWKKLANESITNEQFKNKLHEQTKLSLSNIHDYYGMVEQTGSIFLECECGYLHAPIFSDIIIRDPINFNVLNFGEKGIIQVLSLLPQSYPGHSLLTEDEGMIIGEDDCNCGRKGKYFRVLGRLKNAEIRGCSDTYENRI